MFALDLALLILYFIFVAPHFTYQNCQLKHMKNQSVVS